MAAFLWDEQIPGKGRERTLIQGARCFLLFLMTLAAVALAETPKGIAPVSPTESASQVTTTSSGGGISSTPDNPADEVRKNKSWEYGPFVNWGTGVGDRSDFKFLWAGVQVGKPLTPVLHAGILSGQFEFGANLMPLWLAFTPPPHEAIFQYPGGTTLKGRLAAALTTA